MKIEKVNDHQIRCTLTKADLADRQLKLSELAYGTEKAKDLFRDMMQQASAKFGFEAEDIPLMIEAIPLSGDCIVLIITKVEDPEELDTRFSKFAPSLHDGEEGLNDLPGDLNTDDEVLELFRRVQKSRQAKENKDDSLQEQAKKAESSEDRNLIRLFSFDSLYHLSRISCQLVSFYHGISNLYKNPDSGKYLLVINQSGQEPEDFNRLCNILSEYGQLERYSKAHEAFMAEHYELLIAKEAIQSLALLEAASN
ncbi:MAG: adaptor protein MecA [Lachnospiraceae bacterium]|nr:adaptor protein MecA [Lachnospiraceae bacterium]MDD7027294.1 adaptor protein MecA [Lachnospiraceae bacterium]